MCIFEGQHDGCVRAPALTQLVSAANCRRRISSGGKIEARSLKLKSRPALFLPGGLRPPNGRARSQFLPVGIDPTAQQRPGPDQRFVRDLHRRPRRPVQSATGGVPGSSTGMTAVGTCFSLSKLRHEVCRTKILTAALSVSTRWRPGPWYGSSRCVRSISLSNAPIVTLRSIVVNRNCSQKSGSRLRSRVR